MTDQLNRVAIHVQTGEYVRPENASKDVKYKCPECDELVWFVKGKIVRPYFRHQSQSECTYYTKETDVHLLAKALIENELNKRKRTIRIKRICQECSNAHFFDVEPISEDSIATQEYGFEHNGRVRRADVAIVSNDVVDAIFEICNTNPTSCEVRPEPWFELKAVDVCNILESIREDESDNICILECIRKTFMTGEELMYAVCGDCQTNMICSEVSRGQIHFNQRGAGCGKTYESIQLLNDPRFRHKTHLLYLTKMHSARSVIHKEFSEQYESNRLPGIRLVKDTPVGKQQLIRLLRGETERETTVIIGTIDSFTHAIRDHKKTYSGSNMFERIVGDLAKGIMRANLDAVSYARERLNITDKYLFIIDEAQDLDESYLDAFQQVVDRTGIDTYIIGDKLQSISKEQNLFTYVENLDDERVIKNSAQNINVVKRFHNEKFMSLVNAVVPFEAHGLPPISGICRGSHCTYSHADETEDCPAIKISYDFPSIYETDHIKTEHALNQIIDRMRRLVFKHGYLPTHFCFIFPIVNIRNQFLTLLEPRIQDFWVEVFNDPESYTELFVENLQKSREYWKSKIENREADNKYYKYVYWHRSEENGPINLLESADSTRIMSIHASKGTGCECVFFLGLSKGALCNFTGGIPNTLVYESLLHVGLTRQKKYLYVGIDAAERGDIYNRFKCLGSDINQHSVPYIQTIRTNVDWAEIAKCTLFATSPILECVDFEKYESGLPNKNKNDSDAVIDWGHHVIRNSVLRTNAHKYLSECLDQKGQQLYALRKTIVENKDRIKYVGYKEYQSMLFSLKKSIFYNSNSERKKPISLCIPVLVFLPNSRGDSEYCVFRSAIKDCCHTVIQKLDANNFNFCPIECMMYCYLMDMIQHPFITSVKMLDIYGIMHYYKDCYSSTELDAHSKRYVCDCNKHFRGCERAFVNKEVKDAVVNHYRAVERIGRIMQKYDSAVREFTGNQHVDYKIDKRLCLGDKNNILLRDTSTSWTGYSADGKCIVVGVICPQLTNMNIREILVELFLLHCVLLLSSEERAPKILFSIIHLDAEEPLIVDFNDTFSTAETVDSVRMEIKSRIQSTYSEKHTIVHQFVKWHYEQATHEPNTLQRLKTTLKRVNAILDEEKEDGKTKYRIPTYIKSWLVQMCNEFSNKTMPESRRREIGKGFIGETGIWTTSCLDFQLDQTLREMFRIDVEEEQDELDLR
jgi:hypothetical protein